jgi:hypothetical protein
MWSNVIAVLGTLGGASLVIVSQHWADRRARAEAHRREVKEATGQLLEAVLTYRELYWLWIAGVREGQHEAGADRAARYRARSAITNARDRLALATTHQALIAAAEEATWSAVDLADIETGSVDGEGRFGPDVEALLTAGHERTRKAHTALRRAGTAFIHPSPEGITSA